MATLNQAQLADLITRHFPPGNVSQTGLPIRVTAFAVCRAESGGRTDAYGDANQSIGLFQIYRPVHRQYGVAWLQDPENNASAALAISSGGFNWNPWCTWEGTACGGAGNQRYRGYIQEARAALAPVGAPVAPPAPAQPASSAVPAVLVALGGAALLFYALSGRPTSPTTLALSRQSQL